MLANGAWVNLSPTATSGASLRQRPSTSRPVLPSKSPAMRPFPQRQPLDLPRRLPYRRALRKALRNSQRMRPMGGRQGDGLTGAEIITEYLVRERVPYVVGLCGHGDLGLLEALHERRDEIRTLSVHHESAAGFIADAYFRVRHEPLATFTSCAPGSAFMDSSALLAVTGNVPTTQFGRSPFQETGRYFQADFPSVLRPYVKRSFQATRADQLPLMLRQAFATMLGGRPGPVHLDVPLDVFVETSAEEIPDPGPWRGGISSRRAAAQDDIEAVL